MNVCAKKQRAINVFVWLRRRWWSLALLSLGAFYLITRLLALTRLPVFADEAIYIYWSQLAASDWQRFAFYPLNDGKTPLLIWLMIPLQFLCRDPLWAGRLVSVIFGLGQIYVTMLIVSLFSTRRRYRLLAGLLVIISPGLLLNSRLALMDTASTFWVSLTFYLAYRALACKLTNERHLRFALKQHWWLLALAAAVSFGAALWTKFSNVLLLPVLATLPFYLLTITDLWNSKKTRRNRAWRDVVWIVTVLGGIGFLGLCLFATLKLTPVFSQLFARGGDFLYRFPEFFQEPFSIMARGWQLFVRVAVNYCGSLLWWVSVVLALGLAIARRRFRPLLLLLSGLAYCLPIIILGKVVYPRYFLPLLPFVIASFCVALSMLRRPSFVPFKIVLVSLLLLIGSFDLYLQLTALEKWPLLAEDRVQLIGEWSAGYGIRETVAFLSERAQTRRLLVLTEGHIGTLPDGLQIYLWKSPVRNNLRIEGLGAPPVRNFGDWPEIFADFDEVYLVVNSHRLEWDEATTPGELVAAYPRPSSDDPTLQVWRVR